jgi:hypothetical protein
MRENGDCGFVSRRATGGAYIRKLIADGSLNGRKTAIARA